MMMVEDGLALERRADQLMAEADRVDGGGTCTAEGLRLRTEAGQLRKRAADLKRTRLARVRFG